MRALIGLALVLALTGCIERDPHSCLHRKVKWWKVHTTTTKLKDGIYMLRTTGSLSVGNATVLTGPDGVLIVDPGHIETSSRILGAVHRISQRPLRFVIDTHAHGDHACANAQMNQAGAEIIAHENARAFLSVGNYWTPRPAEGGLPQITYKDTLELHLNGEDIQLIHPPEAHTNGDTMVIFRKANVVATGDIFEKGLIPYEPAGPDYGLGGVIAGLEHLLQITDDKTIFVPGHGPVGRRADVEASLAMLEDSRAKIAALKAQGMDLEAIKKLDPLKDLEPKWGVSANFRGRELAVEIYKDLDRRPAAPPTAPPASAPAAAAAKP